jgi:PPOX class probable F420-dependent enzyme
MERESSEYSICRSAIGWTAWARRSVSAPVSVRPGGPQVTAAWVGIDSDEIVLATLPDQRKLRNLRRDPRVALSVPSSTINEWGLLEYLVVYGTARVTEGGAPEVLQRLAHTYLGPDVVFPNMPDPPPGFVTRITPERLGGVGPWNPPRR